MESFVEVYLSGMVQVRNDRKNKLKGEKQVLPKDKIILIIVVIFFIFLTGCNNQFDIPRGQWVKVEETDHFQYYSYEENEYNMKEINSALERLEAFWKETAEPEELWKVDSDTRIKYFKFRDKKQMKKLTGREFTGKAILGKDIVHSIYYSDTHEVSHIITTHHLKPEENKSLNISNFWLEGIAMYYTWPKYYYGDEAEIQSSIGVMKGKSVHFHAKKNLQKNQLPDIKRFIYDNDEFDALNNVISYTAAGSFVTYLIEREQSNSQKIQKYKELLAAIEKCNSEIQILSVFENIFGKKLSLAEAEWKNYLKEWDEEEEVQ